MAKGAQLVKACVEAGYQKIHLDASMPCADDPPALESAVIAARAAILAETAEQAFANTPAGNDAPLYVIGTEVPAPGGETAAGMAPAVTAAEHVRETLELFRAAFEQRGLSAAWERVIALVVQPGVEFGDEVVFPYVRETARPLVSALPQGSAIIYEAHSTDYQPKDALREMVEDHFAILKVGPWLTFAYREAIFALSAIERELLSGRKGVRLSEVRVALDQAMLRNPVYWRSYYGGDEAQQRLSRAFSYSDRSRYYWPEESVQREIDRLFSNLLQLPLPATLLSQYLPLEYQPVRAGILNPTPDDLTLWHIRIVLRTYAAACVR
jgi:D-tagatose-1,6-bisphosphate aldolase subunit GatZ/KbaZ